MGIGSAWNPRPVVSTHARASSVSVSAVAQGLPIAPRSFSSSCWSSSSTSFCSQAQPAPAPYCSPRPPQKAMCAAAMWIAMHVSRGNCRGISHTSSLKLTGKLVDVPIALLFPAAGVAEHSRTSRKVTSSCWELCAVFGQFLVYITPSIQMATVVASGGHHLLHASLTTSQCVFTCAHPRHTNHLMWRA